MEFFCSKDMWQQHPWLSVTNHSFPTSINQYEIQNTSNKVKTSKGVFSSKENSLGDLLGIDGKGFTRELSLRLNFFCSVLAAKR